MRMKLRFGLLALLAVPISTPAFTQAAGEASAVIAPKCDHACLIATVEGHMKALVARDPAQLKLAKDRRRAGSEF